MPRGSTRPEMTQRLQEREEQRPARRAKAKYSRLKGQENAKD